MKKEKTADPKWVIVGFIMIALGGIFGAMMGAHYAGWLGEKYAKKTKILGYVMFVLGAMSITIWKEMAKYY